MNVPAKDTTNEQTLAVWQPRTNRELTSEDGREIERNVQDFLQCFANGRELNSKAG